MIGYGRPPFNHLHLLYQLMLYEAHIGSIHGTSPPPEA